MMATIDTSLEVDGPPVRFTAVHCTTIREGKSQLSPTLFQKRSPFSTSGNGTIRRLLISR